MQSPQISDYLAANGEKSIAMSVADIGQCLNSAIEFAERFKASANKTEDAQAIEILNQINWEALESFNFKIGNVSISGDHLILTKARTSSE